MKTLARPSHADYTAECKYHGYQDSRGGGHFSGRITAALVAAGAVCKLALEQKGIYIGTHVKRCAGISDREFDCLKLDINELNVKTFAVLDEPSGEKMREAILAAASEGDSVGGVLETAIIGMPAGVGEPWFDTVESMLSHMMFSIPAVKGVEFGNGFGAAQLLGSENNDPFIVQNGKVQTLTNNAGGILGGITNAMPLTLRVAIKPTPSIAKPQRTVNLSLMENTTITVKGRHDPCIVPRAVPVVEAAAAIAIFDAWLEFKARR